MEHFTATTTTTALTEFTFTFKDELFVEVIDIANIDGCIFSQLQYTDSVQEVVREASHEYETVDLNDYIDVISVRQIKQPLPS